MSLILNPNEEYRNMMLTKIEENEGYCPCTLVKDDDTICPCKKFREEDKCCCKLYVEEEV